jgi:hypothetical protein
VEFDRVDCFGQISVRISRNWVQSDEEEDGTYGFFHPGGSSGTVRVSLFVNKRTEAFDLDMMFAELFDLYPDENVKFFRVGDFAVAEWDEPARKQPDVHMFYWVIDTATSLMTTKRAMFSYAVEAERLSADDFKSELEMVRDCVFATEFSTGGTADVATP